MQGFVPPAIFWEIMLFIVLVGIGSYMFGVWDKLGHAMSIMPKQAFIIVVGGCLLLLASIAVGIVATYFGLAYCHKWFGPIVFGG